MAGSRLKLLISATACAVRVRAVPVQHEVGDDGGEIGVAAPLPEAEEGALDVRCARPHSRKRGRDRRPRVVVEVHAHFRPAAEVLRDRFREPICALGRDPAVGVAEDDGVRARAYCRFETAHRVGKVLLRAVVEVLRVKDDTPPVV